MTDEEFRGAWAALGNDRHAILNKGQKTGGVYDPESNFDLYSNALHNENERVFEPEATPLFPVNEDQETPVEPELSTTERAEQAVKDLAAPYVAGFEIAKNLYDEAKKSQLYAAYVYNAKSPEYAEKCRYIQEKTGVDATQITDTDTFTKAWKLAQEVEQKENLSFVTDADGHVDMNKLYEMIPVLQDLHHAGDTAGALMILKNAKGFKSINDAYEGEGERFLASVREGLERGWIQTKRQGTGVKAMARGLAFNEGLTEEEKADVARYVQEQTNTLGYSYSSPGALLGALIGSAAENVPIMLPKMMRGAAVASGILAPATGGTSLSATAAFGTMAAMISGGQFIDFVTETDESGKAKFTPREAAVAAVIGGTINAAIEDYSMSEMGHAAFGGGKTATKLAELYAKRDAAIAGGESLAAATKDIIYNQLSGGLTAGIKSGYSELREEFLQEISDTMTKNVLEIATRGDKADVTSIQDTLENAFMAAVEAVPAVAGFGLIGGGLNVAANTQTIMDARERFKRAQGDRLMRNVYENEYRAGIINNVADNINNIEELKNKAPDLAREALDSMNKAHDMEYTDMNLIGLYQTSGEEAVQEIAQAAGVTQEEVDACLNGTGRLTLKTSALQEYMNTLPVERRADFLQHISGEGGVTTAEAVQYAQDIAEAMKVLQEQGTQDETKAIDSFVNDSFQDDDKEIAREIIAADVANPAAEVARRQRVNQAAIDEILSPIRETLKSGMGQGVDVVETLDLNGETQTTRASNNALWYRNFYADNGRAPTAKELDDIAYENAIGTATRYANDLLDDGSQEAQEYYAGMKETLDGLFAQRESLARIGAVMNTIGKDDFMAVASMPGDAREAYQYMAGILRTGGNKEVATSAKFSAMLAARMAGRVAQMKRDAGVDKNATAMSVLPDILFGSRGAVSDAAAAQTNIYHQFAGAKAKTADWMKLAEAEQMEAEGKSAEEIYKATGWFKGKDGAWRYEIPDNLEGINLTDLAESKGHAAYSLGYLYDNPELYEAYPWMKEIPVIGKYAPVNEYLGYVQYQNGESAIVLNLNYLDDPKDDRMKETLVHEVQHVIQMYEGFARGGDDKNIRKILERELNDLENKKNRLSTAEKNYIALTSIIEERMLGLREENEEEDKRDRELREEVTKNLTEEEKLSAIHLRGKISKLEKLLEKSDFDLYSLIGGEQEARMTSNRAGLRKDIHDAKIKVFEAELNLDRYLESLTDKEHDQVEEYITARKKAQAEFEASEKMDGWYDVWRLEDNLPANIRKTLIELFKAIQQAEVHYPSGLEEKISELPKPHSGDAIIIFGDEVVSYDKRQTEDDNLALRQMAGRKAKGADIDALLRAKWMNKSAEEIYNETGWVRGKDGEWRFEIPDNMEDIHIDEKLDFKNGKASLGDIYDNPALFAAYPFLKRIRVVLADLDDGLSGRTYGRTIEISRNDVKEKPEEVRRTIIHEIQHLIQDREGFASGGSAESVRDVITRNARQEKRISEMSDEDLYWNLAGEQEARLTERRAYLKYKLDEVLDARADWEEDLETARKANDAKRVTECERQIQVNRQQEKDIREELNAAPIPHDENAVVYFDNGAVAMRSMSDLYSETAGMERALDRFLQRAWHGSPHVFESFDLGAIGTGEGAQVHGWGLYFAKDREVSEGYKERLGESELVIDGYSYKKVNGEWGGEAEDDTGVWYDTENLDSGIRTALEYLDENSNDKDKAIQALKESEEDYKDEAIDFLNDAGEIEARNGSLFEVEIPDDDTLLDEQLTFEKQPEDVQNALLKEYATNIEIGGAYYYYSPDGYWLNEDMEIIYPDDGGTSAALDALLESNGDIDGAKEYIHENDIPRADEVEESLQEFTDYGDIVVNEGINLSGWTGRAIYGDLIERKGGDRAASEFLNSIGIEGITYVGGRDGRCFVVFDDNAIEIIERYNQMVNSQSALGEYTPRDNIIRIFEGAEQSTFMHEMAHFYLNELRNLANVAPDSQAAHDMATILEWATWRPGMADEYKGTATAAEFRDYENQILAAEKAGNVKEAERLKYVWLQERFARGFEDYLREGKAPTNLLKKAFRAFKRWITQIYKDFTGAGAKPSAEVQAVMDRMIASDEEIETMAVVNRAEEIAKISPELLDANTTTMMTRWAEEAKEQAKEKLLAELIKQQEAKDVDTHIQKFREEEAERLRWEDVFQAEILAKGDGEIEGIGDEAAAELAGYPSVDAYHKELEAAGGSFDKALENAVNAERERYIKEMPNAQQIHDAAEEALLSNDYTQRLSALEAEILKRREKKYENAPKRLADALRDLEEAAEIENADNPLQEALYRLKYAHKWDEKQKAAIAEMQETINKIRAREKSGKAKLRHKLNTQIAAFREMTLKNKEWLRGVRDAAKGRTKEAREYAKNTLESMPIKDATNWRRFATDAKKAAQDCMKYLTKAISGNKAEEVKNLPVVPSIEGKSENPDARQAYLAKLREVVLNAQTAEAIKLRDELAKIRKAFERIDKGLTNDKRGEIDASTRYYLRHIMYALGLRKQDAPKPQTLISFDALIDEAKDAFDARNNANGQIGDLDVDFNVPGWIAALANGDTQTDYREYTMPEMREVRDIARTLYTVMRNKNRLLTMDKTVDEVVAEMRKDFEETVTVEAGDTGINDYFARVLKPIVMLKAMGKTFVKYIYNPLFDGWEQQTKMYADAAKDLKDLFDKHWTAKERRAMRKNEKFDSLPDGTQFSKEQILVLALNWGNEGNRIRALNGLSHDTYRATVQDVEEMFSRSLGANDWAFVQEVWDYINKFGDEVNGVVEKLQGAPMKRVEPEAFTITLPDGGTMNLKGGYYPIVYDAEKSVVRGEQELMTAAQAVGGASALGRGMGSTKARSQEGLQESPLDLSMDNLFRHVEQQIHIAAMRLPCRDVYKILTNRDVQSMITRSLGIPAYRQLKRWVENVWIEPIMNVSPTTRFLERIRSNTVAAIMGARTSVAVLNTIPNLALIAREMGPLKTLGAVLKFYVHPLANREWVLKESPFMANRTNNIDRDLKQAQKDSFAASPFDDVIKKTGGWLIAETDMMFSLAAYQGQYNDVLNEEMEKGASLEEAKKKAHYSAEELVRRIYGSADAIDASYYQRSKDLVDKALTPFYTYVSTQANVIFEEYLKSRYHGSERTRLDNGEIHVEKKAFFRRHAGLIHAALWTYVIETLIEQLMRDGIEKLVGGDDDKKDDFLKRWAVQSLSGFMGAFPILNLGGEAVGNWILGNTYPTRAFGVIDTAMERIKKVITDLNKVSKGKGDAIEIGRDLTRAIAGTGYGFPDTFTDAIFNLAKAFRDHYSAWDWLTASLFDRKLKDKKGKK